MSPANIRRSPASSGSDAASSALGRSRPLGITWSAHVLSSNRWMPRQARPSASIVPASARDILAETVLRARARNAPSTPSPSAAGSMRHAMALPSSRMLSDRNSRRRMANRAVGRSALSAKGEVRQNDPVGGPHGVGRQDRDLAEVSPEDDGDGRLGRLVAGHRGQTVVSREQRLQDGLLPRSNSRRRPAAMRRGRATKAVAVAIQRIQRRRVMPGPRRAFAAVPGLPAALRSRSPR